MDDITLGLAQSIVDDFMKHSSSDIEICMHKLTMGEGNRMYDLAMLEMIKTKFNLALARKLAQIRYEWSDPHDR